MRLMSRVFSLWRNLVHRDRIERDLDDEVRGLVSLLVDEKVQAGMRPERPIVRRCWSSDAWNR